MAQRCGFSAPRESSGPKGGRPAVQITEEQLRFFVANNYTAKKMAEHFGCSSKVVKRRLQVANIKLWDRYTDINKEELDKVVQKKHEDFPNAGQKMMQGYLRASGVNVQRQKVRDAMRHVDPEGTEERWASALKRRQYSVATPNSLWHLDAHLKLNKRGFVTHGCIDGFSRMVVYVRCATDIMASTPLKYFVNGCINFGIPSRTRTDHGQENTKIALFMNLVRGTDRGSHIAGRSVHNQRIERLWRDVYTQVTDPLYTKFFEMEDDGDLDVENRAHITALHFVYLPVINNRLEEFRHAWNMHPLSSTQNRTPRTLWIDGMLQNMGGSHTAPLELFGHPVSLVQVLETSLAKYGLSLEDIPDTEDQDLNQHGDPRVRLRQQPYDLEEGHRDDLARAISGVECPHERYRIAVSLIQRWF